MHKTALASACMAAACVAMLFAASGGSSVELEAGGRRRRAEAFDVDKVFHKAFSGPPPQPSYSSIHTLTLTPPLSAAHAPRAGEGEEDEGDEGVARIRLHHRAKWLADGEKKEDTFASSYSGRREAEESRGGSSSHGSTRRRISGPPLLPSLRALWGGVVFPSLRLRTNFIAVCPALYFPGQTTIA